MKITMRMWILAIVLGLSIISLVSAGGNVKLMIFLLIVGVLFIPKYVKSKVGSAIIITLFLLTAIFLIYGSVESGVIVRSIESDSPLFETGLRQGEIIKEINGKEVIDVTSYALAIEGLFENDMERRIDVITNEGDYTIFTNESPRITIDDVPKTNIQTGLDLRGGARALVQPDTEISDSELNDLIAISRNRFNVFGLSDVNIRGVRDLSGNRFMLVEVAGSTPSDLEELISQQGKFEAKIGNTTVFEGGNKDISDVCRTDASCSGIRSCFASSEGGYVCSFAFTIFLRENAAKRHAEVTGRLGFNPTGEYLNESLYLFVDDNEVDSLLISANLKGQVATQILIQGSGKGLTRADAFEDAKESMNKLQTILITGSLPYKLEIVKLDTISPLLGEQFVYLILLAGIIALFAVGVIVFIRYRKFKPSVALLFTAFSEIVIILGIASLIRWNLDLPSIAGILATIGTGVDQQIVILDEAESGKEVSLKERMKRAMFVIGTAYATSVVSLIPLYWAGAGLFKGFALTTIIGITAGVLITRPAFADIIKGLNE